ncbi:MAG: GNAT family N-acetyltransferase [Rhizobiaceae bacterium]|nr:GNAT family N-acetyltransferase [Rhizobiaceae bacterium]
MTKVRHMTGEDAAEVAALLAGSWKRTYAPLIGAEKVADEVAGFTAERIAADLKRPHSEAFVALAEGGGISGYAYAIVEKGVLWLDRLHVRPEHQGSGAASALLSAVMINYLGEPSISLEVIEGNDRAIRFYEKNGFEPAERKSACGSIQGVPTRVMRRPLPRA